MRLQDDSDEKKVVALPLQANVFCINNQATISERLRQNMVMKEMVTTQIDESLLNANSLGQVELISFVKMVVIRSSGTFFLKIKLPHFNPL